jgi:hypothetical protein
VTDLARTYANLAITTETVNDALMQYNSHALGIELVGGLTKYPQPEIYTYTFPEHPIFSGSCNNQEGLIYYYDDLEKPTREEAMNRVFLMGYRFDIMIGCINENDLYHQYLKKLITLRQKIKPEIYESDFRDTIGLGELPKNFYAKLFRRIDRNNLIVTLLDRRKDLKESFNLSIDLSKNDLSKAKDVTLYLLNGNELNLQFQETEDGILKLAMPSLDSGVSVILIKF